MNVEVETLPDCVSTLRIELPPDQVSKEWDSIANNYAQYARIPGYRPGKAPKRIIEAKYRKEIQDELTKKLVSKSYHEAVASKQLRVVSLTNLEDVEFGDDRSMKFRATVVLAPEFSLPDYSTIPIQLPDAEVTDAEVDAALERLREQAADFVDVTPRALQMEDFAVVDFAGQIDGQPISEIAPQASKNVQGGKKFWLRLAPDNFLPNFCEQLVGLAPNETRTVRVEFPADFPVAELAGKAADYEVTLHEIKEKVLPPLDDEFAGKLAKDKTLAEVRGLLTQQLESEKAREIARARETQILAYLIERTTFDLPPNLLKQETKRVLSALVQQNRERGVPDEALKGSEKELIQIAGQRAYERLKSEFILHRIAEAEKIEVLPEDVNERLRVQAAQYNVPPEKLRKELSEHDGLRGLADEVLLAKTLDLLQANVSVEPISQPDVSGSTSEPKS